VDAYSNDIPFIQFAGEAPELMAPLADDQLAACAFQVFQFSLVMDHDRIGDVEYTEVRRRLLPQADGTDIPDGALLTLDIDPSGEIFGSLAYNSNLFAEASMVDMVTRYVGLLEKAVGDPDVALADL
jgi:hypothetical protein